MTIDLTNADLDALDALMAHTPAPLRPMDAVMIDGYLAGVSIQPRIVPVAEWLPGVFDVEGRALPADHDPAWLARCRALLGAALRGDEHRPGGDVLVRPRVIVDIDSTPPVSEYETPKTPAELVLGPWLGGFGLALERFTDLQKAGDGEIDGLLARLSGCRPANRPRTSAARSTCWSRPSPPCG